MSPVPVSFSLARATMSPAPASSMALVSLPCMSRMFPVRSFSPVRLLTNWESVAIFPEKTRARLTLPENWS